MLGLSCRLPHSLRSRATACVFVRGGIRRWDVILKIHTYAGLATFVNLMIYGMNTCTSIDFSGGTEFIGQIHAPYATISAGGGGGSIQTFCGALCAKALTMVGHFSFHYDESLKLSGPPSSSISIVSWSEL